MAKTSINAMSVGRILSFFILIFLGGETVGFSQAICNASASTTIVNSVSIPKNVNSEFGNVAIIVSGTVELTPVDKNTPEGSIVLPVTSGTFTAATYYFAGNQGYAFTVSAQSSPLVVRKGPLPMHVKSFDSSPVQSESTGMIAGVYISVSPSRVTVNYN